MRVPLNGDLEKLLAPITTERPGGEWLRDEDIYSKIQEARRREDASLPRGVWQRDLKSADWLRVEELCLDLLERRSKDLQLAAWLLEAWIPLYGYAGLEPGFRLLASLVESFWPDLWPPLEDDDFSYRIAPLVWLNEKLHLEVKRLPLTRPNTEDAPIFSWADWESAVRLAQVAEHDPAALEAAEAHGRVTREKFLASVTLTSSDHFRRCAEDLDVGLAALANLVSQLRQRCGNQAPSLGQMQSTVEALYHFCKSVLKERGETTTGGGESEDDDFGDAGPLTAGHPEGLQRVTRETEAALAAGPIRGRADAYRRLAEVAEYLLRTEPHSPTPYLVKRAVSWGGLTLAELLAELLEANADLDTVYRLLGIAAPEEEP